MKYLLTGKALKDDIAKATYEELWERAFQYVLLIRKQDEELIRLRNRVRELEHGKEEVQETDQTRNR